MVGYEFVFAIVQFATLLVLIVTLGVFWRQLSIVQSDFKARMRPYLGFTEISREEIGEPHSVEFAVLVKNFGSLPAKNAKLSGEFIINGGESAPFEASTRGSVFLFDEARWRVGVTDVDRDAILDGLKKLRLKLKVEYYGSGMELYRTYSYRVYDPERNDWRDEEGNWA